MKKILWFSALATLFSLNTMIAQNAAGLRIGTTWNNAVSRDLNGSLDFKTMNGITAGAFYEIGLSPNFSLQPELQYTEKGFRVDEGTNVNLFGQNLPVGVSAVSVIKYADAALLAKYKFGTEGVRFYAMAGPTVGYALNGALQTRARLLIDFKVGDTPIDLNANNYKRVELGGMVGAGVELPVSEKVNLFADVRYTRSLMDVYEVPVVGSRLRNQGIGANVGFAYKF